MEFIMGFINSESKFNQNSYLIDGELYRMKGNVALYIIENKGMRMMIDAGESLMAKKVVKKIIDLGLYPIHKILLTHSHFDHIQGVAKIKKLIKEEQIEVLASERAIDNLRNPDKMNKDFGYIIEPIENVTPLKEGDVVNLNGLELEILNFFGHTQDSIAVLDRKNKNIFVGDAIMDKFDYNTFLPEFNEITYLKTIDKLKNLKEELNSLALAHFGVWTEYDCYNIISEAKNFHINAKESLIAWYNENPSLSYITLKYHEKFIPDSKIHTKENILGLQMVIEWLIKGLKKIGYLK
jgi:glyoxylase-like metal-dependent hydrolase (beta-lactamase superfamily II)